MYTLIGFAAFFISYISTQIFTLPLNVKPFNCIFCLSVWISLVLTILNTLTITVNIFNLSALVTLMLNFFGAAGIAIFLILMVGIRYVK